MDENLRMWSRDDLVQMVTEQRRTIDALYADKRDQFAMAAMQAYLTRFGNWNEDDLAKCSYRTADAMLKARGGTNAL